jgi:hypothetical protein
MGGGDEEDGGPLNGAARVTAVVGGRKRGVLTRRRPNYMVVEPRSRGSDSKEGETEDRLGHWRKHGSEHRRARVRSNPNQLTRR